MSCQRVQTSELLSVCLNFFFFRIYIYYANSNARHFSCCCDSSLTFQNQAVSIKSSIICLKFSRVFLPYIYFFLSITDGTRMCPNSLFASFLLYIRSSSSPVISITSSCLLWSAEFLCSSSRQHFERIQYS